MAERIKVSAVLTMCNHGEVHLSVTDAASRVEFLELHMTKEQFAYIFNNRHHECEAEVRGLDLVGKERHWFSKKVPTEYPKPDQARTEALAKEHHPGDPFKFEGIQFCNDGMSINYGWYGSAVQPEESHGQPAQSEQGREGE